ncbi:MAG: AzlC family ABC transporter permease [Lachnospiraceae bacterium]|nr:AzlC family ABC transporter permease [Lachnospiraceae bacterium]
MSKYETPSQSAAPEESRAPVSRGAWIRKGLRDGFPVCMGYFAVSFALGIAARNVGLSAVQAFFMSLGMVASAGEFAALTLIAAGAGVLEMIVTSLVVNLRYFLMSCSLTQKLDPKTPFWQKMILAFFVTDENFGLSSVVDGYLCPFYSYAIAVISVSGWCAGTVLGVVIGNILPDSVVAALSVALYGMFLAIIIPPAKKDRFLRGLVAASMAASGLFAVTPYLKEISSGFRIIILTLALAGAAALIKPVNDPDADAEDISKKEVEA